jgi:predicted transcriptional regulator YheO
MTKPEKQATFALVKQLARGIAAAVGPHCEVVVHDFAEPERSIIAIENGRVTGREVGDGLDDLGFEMLREGSHEDLMSYRTTSRDGRQLRSSSIHLRDEHGEAFGAVCINYDISPYLAASKFLEEVTATENTGIQEGFQKSVTEVLDELARVAIQACGKRVEEMNREDKIAVVAFLERRGAFLIRHSADRLAALLNISKFTIYNYLDELKARQAGAGKAKAAGRS